MNWLPINDPDSKDTQMDVDYISIRHENIGLMFDQRRSGICFGIHLKATSQRHSVKCIWQLYMQDQSNISQGTVN